MRFTIICFLLFSDFCTLHCKTADTVYCYANLDSVFINLSDTKTVQQKAKAYSDSLVNLYNFNTKRIYELHLQQSTSYYLTDSFYREIQVKMKSYTAKQNEIKLLLEQFEIDYKTTLKQKREKLYQKTAYYCINECHCIFVDTSKALVVNLSESKNVTDELLIHFNNSE